MYKIYEIRCNETGEVYIGKTIKTLKERLNNHKKKLDCTSKQIILRRNYVMSKIDSCDTEEESIFLESYYIRNTDNCVNIHIPDRNKIEYNKQYNKQYYEKNKDEILIKMKERHKVKYTCECGSTLTVGGKSHHEKSQRHINFINSK